MLARWLMLGTVAFTCTIFLTLTMLARQIKGQELGQSSEECGIKSINLGDGKRKNALQPEHR